MQASPHTPVSSVGQSTDRLSVEGVSVRFGGLTALSDITLSLNRGEIVGLIGPNGAGKTTLVNVLTGFQKPTSGTVLLGRENTGGWSADRIHKAGVARTFQSGRLFSKLTVAENAEVAGIAMGDGRRAARRAADEVLGWIGLGDSRSKQASSLPYTDQRRLDIARALCARPSFLLLDEPAAGMSDAECDSLCELVALIPKRYDCAVLLIEHNMHVVMGLSSRLHVLDGGKTIAEGTPAEIQSHEAFLRAYLGAEIVE